jgi:3-dehydroquinate synthase
VALGGGVTGDLAGFVASTYLRGVPLVSVPTSLLAMLDSSVGGKTGVDTDSGKNLVGTFHHPVLVVVDPDLLSTLPPRHLRAGLAEGVKMAAIRDATLFQTLEEQAPALRDGDPPALLQLIEASIRHKAEVVAADPEETGLRQILNFGHTAGHALETLSGYTQLHGEAVAAGMRLESRLGEAVGVTEPGTTVRLEALLDAVGLLPGKWPGVDELLAAASADKKVRGGIVRWVLLERIGSVAPDSRGAWTHGLDKGAVVAGLRAAFPAEADVRDSAS